VRGVIAASISEASMLQVSGSMSTKTGTQPASTIISAVAAKVNGVVMTSSPAAARAPSGDQQRLGAAGHRDAVAAASEGGQRLLEFVTSGPMMYWPWSSTRWMRASMLVLSAAYWAFKSVNCMACMALRVKLSK
jgi:hypothetical protein